MKKEDDDDQEFGLTWETVLRERGYPESTIQELAEKRRRRESVLYQSDGEESDS